MGSSTYPCTNPRCPNGYHFSVRCPNELGGSKTHAYGTYAHKNCALKASGNMKYLPSTTPDSMWQVPEMHPPSAMGEGPGRRTVTLDDMRAVRMDAPDLSTVYGGMRLRRAISEFRLSDNAVWINQRLRAGESLYDDDPDADEEDRRWAEEVHRCMSEAVRDSVLRQELRVYRGTRSRELFPGEVISTPGWTSTSMDPTTARQFEEFEDSDGRMHHDLPTRMTIDLSEGTHVINTLKEDVAEFVLPPNTEMVMVEVRMEDGVQVVRARVEE